jgi:hypothetical protein
MQLPLSQLPQLLQGSIPLSTNRGDEAVLPINRAPPKQEVLWGKPGLSDLFVL